MNVRAAVVGCGRMGAAPTARLAGKLPPGWAPLSHAEAVQSLEGWELVGLCDSQTQTAQKWGAHYGAPAYDSVEILLAEARPDFLCVATRTPAKKAIIETALSAGVRALYVEKPVATSIDDAQAILRLAQEKGASLALGVNRRYHPVYRQAREWLRQGEIGDLVEITIEHGRSALLWSHPHSVDLLLFFAGAAPQSVQAVLDPETVVWESEMRVDSDPVVENACFRFPGGVTGLITRSGGLNVRLAGTRGTIAVGADGSYLEARKQGASGYFLETRTAQSLGGTGATATALAETWRAAQGQGEMPLSPGEILASTQMLLGIVWSAREGNGPVSLTAVPSALTVTGRSGTLYA
ncbi:Gfo/Idh/MocA family oxidoreductase [bacterium]|nr:Gfo/Idh/MocA family oxidoreductase [bacterium]